MTRFRTIVADPPWATSAGRALGDYRMRNGKQLFSIRDNRARALAYPTMTVDQIVDLPVSQLAATDSHLYLWTINHYLPHAFPVLQAWGFRYSTTLVWAKRPMGGGLGGPYGLATEFVLFCRRGQLKTLGRIGRNWFDWKRPYDKRGKPKHSAKPPDFYDLVTRVSPGPYLDLFARETRAGWSVWGNEVTSDVRLCVPSVSRQAPRNT